jgi:hypothetical protein
VDREELGMLPGILEGDGREKCGTINTITLEEGELKKQV